MDRSAAERQVSIMRVCALIATVLVLFSTSSAAPASSKLSESQELDSLDNPCNYLDHKLRHQRSTNKDSGERHKNLLLVHVKLMRRAVTKALNVSNRMFPTKSEVPFSKHLVNRTVSSKIDVFYGLQVFARAVTKMQKQKVNFSLTQDELSRLSNLRGIQHSTLRTLCELYDEIHHDHPEEKIRPASESVQKVDEIVPDKMQRTMLATQDKGILKQFRQFLRDAAKVAKRDHRQKEKARRQQQQEQKGNKKQKNNRKNPAKKGKKGKKGKNQKAKKQQPRASS